MGRDLCWRFDIDTEVCLLEGVPALLSIARETGARFTFFVNVGRAFHPLVSAVKVLRRLVRRTPRRGQLSNTTKLGLSGAARAMARNPRLGAIRDARVLSTLVEEGHDLGLHGGRNHALWETRGARWQPGQVRREVEAGLRSMELRGWPRPSAFASPAWITPPGLDTVLQDLGFEILADQCDAAAEEITRPHSGGMLLVPTNVVGDPAHVGYLENLFARGLGEEEVLGDFERQLQGRTFACCYDHPCYAGRGGSRIVTALIQRALQEGWQVRSFSEAVRARSVDGRLPQSDGRSTPQE